MKIYISNYVNLLNPGYKNSHHEMDIFLVSGNYRA